LATRTEHVAQQVADLSLERRRVRAAMELEPDFPTLPVELLEQHFLSGAERRIRGTALQSVAEDRAVYPSPVGLRHEIGRAAAQRGEHGLWTAAPARARRERAEIADPIADERHRSVHEVRCDDFAELSGPCGCAVPENLDVDVRREHVQRSRRTFGRDRSHLGAAVRLDQPLTEMANDLVALKSIELLASDLDVRHAEGVFRTARAADVSRELVNGGRRAPD